MRKKNLFFMLTVLLHLVLAGCGSAGDDSPDPPPSSAVQAHGNPTDFLLIEDFEGPHPKAGGYLINTDTNDLGTVAHPNPFELQPEGSPASGAKSARIWGHLGRHEAPWPWCELMMFLKQDHHSTLDLTPYKSIEFYVKGDGNTYSVKLVKNSMTDYDQYQHLFKAPREWTRVWLPLAAFTQMGWGKQVPRDFSDVRAIYFSATEHDHPFDLWVDDVGLSINEVNQTATPRTKPAGLPDAPGPTNTFEATGEETSIILLHHSTGGVVWNGGVANWFADHNQKHGTRYTITERIYPADGYSWENYPYDYWNIWVKHGGLRPFQRQDTLEILTRDYDVIVWKHCFPVSGVMADTGSPDRASNRKSFENYRLQYQALKEKMHRFPNKRFIVWTGAAQARSTTNRADAGRAQRFFDWVKQTWDEPDDNIFVWDFWQLETEGGLYLLDQYAVGPHDSHPNADFAARVAPLFARRVVDIIEGRGDTGSLTGK